MYEFPFHKSRYFIRDRADSEYQQPNQRCLQCSIPSQSHRGQLGNLRFRSQPSGTGVPSSGSLPAPRLLCCMDDVSTKWSYDARTWETFTMAMGRFETPRTVSNGNVKFCWGQFRVYEINDFQRNFQECNVSYGSQFKPFRKSINFFQNWQNDLYNFLNFKCFCRSDFLNSEFYQELFL